LTASTPTETLAERKGGPKDGGEKGKGLRMLRPEGAGQRSVPGGGARRRRAAGEPGVGRVGGWEGSSMASPWSWLDPARREGRLRCGMRSPTSSGGRFFPQALGAYYWDSLTTGK
jgi:hypothetical protein